MDAEASEKGRGISLSVWVSFSGRGQFEKGRGTSLSAWVSFSEGGDIWDEAWDLVRRVGVI